MKTIIVATDFSPAAANAASYAADMAAVIEADVVLLHTYEIPDVPQEVSVAVTVSTIRQHAQVALNNEAARLITRTNNKITIHTELRVGQFFHQLELVCQRMRPYSIVMGSQGNTALTHLLFGSHSVYAVKNLNWPVITVPVTANFSRIRKVGLACDFQDVFKMLPIEEIRRMTLDFDAELHILHTGKETDFNEVSVFKTGQLKQMFSPIVPLYHFISTAQVDEGIMRFADQTGIDLLIVVPKHHGFFEKLLHGSHVKKFVLHSHVPVLALHPQH
ncbi:MAG: universal stress protein [Ferruginibacter sp.]|nr:universal stress protein [Ferruginibacter sp.]